MSHLVELLVAAGVDAELISPGWIGYGRIQREGEVVRLVAHRLEGLLNEQTGGAEAGSSAPSVDAFAVSTRGFR